MKIGDFGLATDHPANVVQSLKTLAQLSVFVKLYCNSKFLGFLFFIFFSQAAGKFELEDSGSAAVLKPDPTGTENTRQTYSSEFQNLWQLNDSHSSGLLNSFCITVQET